MFGYQHYLRAKRLGTSFTTRKTFKVLPNGRSSDFVMPSWRSGCEASCTYCYSARHKPYGNPLVYYDNLDEILSRTILSLNQIPPKASPNQCGPLNTVDIGENTDCLSPKNIPDTNRVIQTILQQAPSWMTTFASKFTHPRNVSQLLPVTPGRARVRASLMPQHLSSILEPGTCLISDRLAGLPLLLQKGFEVHFNFSPVVLYPGWINDWRTFLGYLDSCLDAPLKSQVKAEVIFLTHHPSLHQLNLSWRPQAEDFLWHPHVQEFKTNGRGDSLVLRYSTPFFKARAIRTFSSLLSHFLPYCPIRYIF